MPGNKNEYRSAFAGNWRRGVLRNKNQFATDVPEATRTELGTVKTLWNKSWYNQVVEPQLPEHPKWGSTYAGNTFGCLCNTGAHATGVDQGSAGSGTSDAQDGVDVARAFHAGTASGGWRALGISLPTGNPWASHYVANNGRYWDCYFWYTLPSDLTNLRIWFMCAESSTSVVNIIPNDATTVGSYWGLRFSQGTDANWQIVTNKAGTITTKDCGVAPSNSQMMRVAFRIKGNTAFQVSINGGVYVQTTTNVPTPSTAVLQVAAGQANKAVLGASRNMIGRYARLQTLPNNL